MKTNKKEEKEKNVVYPLMVQRIIFSFSPVHSLRSSPPINEANPFNFYFYIFFSFGLHLRVYIHAPHASQMSSFYFHNVHHYYDCYCFYGLKRRFPMAQPKKKKK